MAANEATSPITMKAIVIHEQGGPEVLRAQSMTLAAPTRGEVRVRHAFIGVNYADIYRREGTDPQMLPFTPGLEASGVVEAIGADVDDVSVGQRVLYARWQGAYADAANVPATSIIPIPDDIDFDTAAALGMQGITAQYLSTEFRRPQAGNTVLVHAAAGGVGRLLVQFARHAGAHVIGTVSSAMKQEIALHAGAHDVIDYATEDFVDAVNRLTAGRGADIVFDGVGRATFHGSLRALAPRGHAILFGAASGPAAALEPGGLLAGSRTVSGADVADGISTHAELLRRAEGVFDGVREGWLSAAVSHVLPLANVAQAHRLLQGRQITGKLLLRP